MPPESLESILIGKDNSCNSMFPLNQRTRTLCFNNNQYLMTLLTIQLNNNNYSNSHNNTNRQAPPPSTANIQMCKAFSDYNSSIIIQIIIRHI